MISYENATVSFFTVCYEGDWERILKENRLERIIRQCNYHFFEKGLIINNVKDRSLVERYAEEAVKKGIIDVYFFSEDYSDKILSEFSIKRSSFRLDFYDGYYYSIGPLTAVYNAKGKYLLYFTGDCLIETHSVPWISESIERMEADKQIFVASARGADTEPECNHHAIGEDESYIYTNGFSDQCFLVETRRLRDKIYNHYHYYTERYPIYGGDLFERRVNGYMCGNQLSRIVKKGAFYSHEKLLNEGLENIPAKPGLNKKIRRVAAKYSRKFRKAINRRIFGHSKKVDGNVRKWHI
ncbi:hypothetical protein [Chitinophaga ginsengisoli]|uniref:Glycosyl transferase family 2 n=1 Tax=Chitinophaga ginsengisoli TaxID=363837 RepID=A0A2P8FPS4_9BACT|nr:hypothetical protein [Chitinophaga ginsengisoli]PSL23693.1 hypothetical protein CLV42_11747 [Chitinophaga ginsengisoli]